MSTIATLNVLVTADNESFIRAFDKSAKKTEEFSLTTRQARTAASDFGRVIGSQTGMFGAAAQSLITLGPAVGGVAAALLALKSGYDSVSEAAKKSAEVQEKAIETIRDSLKAAGDIKTFQGLAAEPDKEIDKIEDKIKELNKDIKDNLNSHLGLNGAVDAAIKDRALVDSLQEQEYRWTHLRGVLDAFQHTMESLSREKLKIEIEGGDQLPILKRQADLVQDALIEAFDPKTTKALQKELDSLNLEIAHIEKTADAKGAARETREAEDIIKAQEGGENNRFEQYFQKALDEAKKLKELVETPAEKFEEHMTRAAELFNQGLLDEETLNRIQTREEEAYDSATKKEFGGISTSTFKQIDPSRISAAGLAQTANKKQEVTSQQLEVTNAILDKIAAKLVPDRPATVAGG